MTCHVDPHRVRLLEHLRLDRTFVRGEGSWLWDAQGRKVLDLTSQYGAVPLGHGPPSLWAALDDVRARAIPALTQPSRPFLAEDLARRLLARAPLAGPAGDGAVTFASSGSEAVEVALAQCRAATGRAVVVAAERAYHGLTQGAGALTWSRARHAPSDDVVHVPWNDPAALEALFARRGLEVAALVLEPLQGEGGVHEADPAWLRLARDLCDRHGAALVLDEVQTGLGRCGALFLGEALGVKADAIVLSKALGGGLVPLAACLATRALHVEAFGLSHGSTFANGNLACAVGLAVLDALEADDLALVRRAAEAGARLRSGLEAVAARHPGVVRGVRGRGLLLGLELEPVGPERSFFMAHLEHTGGAVGLAAGWLLNAEGVRVIPCLGSGRTLRIEPCLTATDAELARGLEALEALVDLFARGDWAALVRPVLDLPPTWPRDLRAHDRPVVSSTPITEGERPTRFAFLMHPTGGDDLARTTPAFASLSPEERDALAAWGAARPSHAPVGFLPAVRGAAGAVAQGWLVSLSDTPTSLRARPRAEVVRDVRAAAETARRLGAEVLGLGAFTSIVTRNGDDLHDLPLAVTTGNALTVALAVEGLDLAARRLGKDLGRARACVVGLGAVGSASAALLAERAPALLLVGRPDRDERRALSLAGEVYARAARDLERDDTRGVARALREGLRRWAARGPVERRRLRALQTRLRALGRGVGLDDPAGLGREVAWAASLAGQAPPVAFAPDRRAALRAADVVLTATSDPAAVIGPDDLRRGAIVCDVAKPADVAAAVVEARPDVLVFEGGLARWPEPLSVGQHLGLPPGVALACLTETVVLALEGARAGRFGRVKGLADEARTLRAAARRHGFDLADLHRGGRALTDDDLAAVRRARLGRAAA
ncbi:MAG: aminotransferase class III-fold pyridoxal phosphate-dependent enzyme [Planctomycetes bacterium]|nr:aminotransferase class III-fold pyridoxal phosphate-dependent enzyme [Planctomycetota bacterium]